MPVEPSKQKLYPHMMANDISIWERFLEQNPGMFDSFQYDVHVAEGRGFKETDPQWMKDLAKALTQLRIDVVAFKGKNPTLIEVKPFTGLSALGQLLGYRYFWLKEHTGFPEIAMMVVTDATTDDIKELYVNYWVKLVETGIP